DSAYEMWRASNQDSAGKLVFVDVRNPDDYDAGHIPGARSDRRTAFVTLFSAFGKGLPEDRWPRFLQDYFESLGIERDTRVVFYGASVASDFGAPGRAALLARLAGIPREHTFVVEEGFGAWQKSGYPESTEGLEVPRSRFDVTLDRSDII